MKYLSLLLALLFACESELPENKPIQCSNLDRVLEAFEKYLEENELERAQGSKGACAAQCLSLVSDLQEEVCKGTEGIDKIDEFECEMLCECHSTLEIPEKDQLAQVAQDPSSEICTLAVEEHLSPDAGTKKDAGALSPDEPQ